MFEYITLGAGSITVELNPDKTYQYSTVPFVKRKKQQIDLLLSTTLVEDIKEL